MNKNSKYKILIVDDVEDNLTLVDRVLTTAGYSTHKERDGLATLRAVRDKKYDLILLDIMMPIMSGIEVCKYLKVDAGSASIPVIFLTANADKDTLIKAFNAGGNDYIRKPFVKEELLARVSSRLKLREYEKNLEEKVYQRTKEIEETQVKLMQVLGGISEGHSEETYEHVKRVSEFTYKLARYCKMDEEESSMLKNASSLHDIGKLGVTDSILHKEGKLDKKEYKEIQKHVLYGVDMLKHSELPLFKTARIVAEQHHEKYDGTGYPYRLKGEEIHLYGRIVALADVFDALLHKRAYKNSWSQEEVLKYVRDMSGKHFDPELIMILFTNIDDFLNIYNEKSQKKSHSDRFNVEKSKIVKMFKINKRNRVIEWFLRRR